LLDCAPIGYSPLAAAMGPWSRVRALVPNVPRWLLVLAGLWALVRSALAAMGGYDRLWLFGRMEQSRYTAMAILTGTLKLRNGLTHVGHDEQVYNGAGYTNWGFGVPLLEVPFHWAASHMARYPSKFFPDRAIYFFYLLLSIPVLWAAFDRLLAVRERVGASRMRRHVLSWSATLFVLTVTLYPLMSCRFIVYEETICYLMVFELLALSAYVFALGSWSSGAVAAMGVAAGMGLLIRPTALVYVGVWGMLVLLEGRRKKPVAIFAAAVAPFVAFWLYSNWVRSGSPFALGVSNSLPGLTYHTPMLRFGSQCAATRAHALEAATRLFRGFFLTVNDEPLPLPALPSAHAPPAPPIPAPWTKKCHFDWELRSPDTQSYSTEPFFGLAVLVVLAWILLHHLARRERRLSVYLPFATFAFLFANYVHSVAGFAWRYVGDFWPLIVLAVVQYVHSLPRGANRVLGLPLALAVTVASYACYVRNIEPALATLETIDPNEPGRAPKAMWDDFSNSRYSMDPALPSSFKCGDQLTWPWHNGEGWTWSWWPSCSVDTFSNIYLGVPAKSDDNYELRFATKGMRADTKRVYVNGRVYTAYKSGDDYSLNLQIPYRALTSPIVMITIEWTSEFEPVPGELVSVELS
jgi:hypothetical protein